MTEASVARLPLKDPNVRVVAQGDLRNRLFDFNSYFELRLYLKQPPSYRFVLFALFYRIGGAFHSLGCIVPRSLGEGLNTMS